MTKASTFFDKVIAATAPSKPSIDLNEDTTNTTASGSNGYPPWANKIGHFIYMLWDKCLWTPFSRTWAFLNRWTNLTFWIFASIPIGVLVGYYQPEFATEIKPLGTAFIRMIKICVVPLIFSTLVVGIAGMFVPSIVNTVWLIYLFRSWRRHFKDRQIGYQNNHCMYECIIVMIHGSLKSLYSTLKS